ncbi:uncharacterized protein BJ171DRAFT_223468 [Polychytrium aggregatum]|uniref:uncharacterized protein n=1 Tax=Polychytrium aggregatum TaxID=110093 RepID=UPI0022FF2758|nr:uncharacterized protein BJ171DRAFT_223468 [Polychytrium aggregatum]KAI9197386.1 hypothetical protein BJ171DRAFT_223468 [Polychytrium aggregatum]
MTLLGYPSPPISRRPSPPPSSVMDCYQQPTPTSLCDSVSRDLRSALAVDQPDSSESSPSPVASLRSLDSLPGSLDSDSSACSSFACSLGPLVVPCSVVDSTSIDALTSGLPFPTGPAPSPPLVPVSAPAPAASGRIASCRFTSQSSSTARCAGLATVPSQKDRKNRNPQRSIARPLRPDDSEACNTDTFRLDFYSTYLMDPSSLLPVKRRKGIDRSILGPAFEFMHPQHECSSTKAALAESCKPRSVRPHAPSVKSITHSFENVLVLPRRASHGSTSSGDESSSFQSVPNLHRNSAASAASLSGVPAVPSEVPESLSLLPSDPASMDIDVPAAPLSVTHQVATLSADDAGSGTEGDADPSSSPSSPGAGASTQPCSSKRGFVSPVVPIINPKMRGSTMKGQKPLPDFLAKLFNHEGQALNVNMSDYSDTKGASAIVWKGSPLKIPSSCEHYDDLTMEELRSCSVLRIYPAQYLHIKQTLLAAVKAIGPFKKRDAQGWFHIDVNKTNKVYDWFVSIGWIPTQEEWESRIASSGGATLNERKRKNRLSKS